MKLISKPSMCAFNKVTADKHFCNHPSPKTRYCTWTNKFPSGCPLQDGITKEQDNLNIYSSERNYLKKLFGINDGDNNSV